MRKSVLIGHTQIKVETVLSDIKNEIKIRVKTPFKFKYYVKNLVPNLSEYLWIYKGGMEIATFLKAITYL
jgi:hypothetical protein